MIEISKEAKAKYIQRRKDNLVTLQNSLEKKETEEFKMIGHQLKGNARTFGFNDLEKIAIELEGISESLNWARASELIQDFRLWIEKNQ